MSQNGKGLSFAELFGEFGYITLRLIIAPYEQYRGF